MKFYKVLTWDLKSPFSSNPLLHDAPKDDGTPGEWTPFIQMTRMCNDGYHVTTAKGLGYWHGNVPAARIFECECRWPNGVEPGLSAIIEDDRYHGKLVSCSIRLLREVFLPKEVKAEIDGFDNLVGRILGKMEDPELPPNLRVLVSEKDQIEVRLHYIEGEIATFNKGREMRLAELRQVAVVRAIDELQERIANAVGDPPGVHLLTPWLSKHKVRMSITMQRRDVNHPNETAWKAEIGCSQQQYGKTKIFKTAADPKAAIDALCRQISGAMVYHCDMLSEQGEPFQLQVPILVPDDKKLKGVKVLNAETPEVEVEAQPKPLEKKLEKKPAKVRKAKAGKS